MARGGRGGGRLIPCKRPEAPTADGPVYPPQPRVRGVARCSGTCLLSLGAPPARVRIRGTAGDAAEQATHGLFGCTMGVSPELPYMPLISSAHSSQRSESLPSYPRKIQWVGLSRLTYWQVGPAHFVPVAASARRCVRRHAETLVGNLSAESWSEPCLDTSYRQLQIRILVGPQGFEPWTNGLKVHCSTAELRASMRNACSESGYS